MPSASKRPRIALVTPVMPAESGNGLAMRAGLLLEGLARAGAVQVLVVPLFGAMPGDGAPFVQRRAASVDVLPLTLDPDPVADLTARLSDPRGRATAAAVHPRPALCRAATWASAGAVAERVGSVDLVVVFRLYLAPFLDVLFGRQRRPRLWLDVDEVDSTTQRLMGDAPDGARFARLEAHYLPQFDLVTAASADDARALEEEHRLPAAASVPNATRPPDLATFGDPDPIGPASRLRRDLLFVANLSYRPNEEGACWLAREIGPRLGEVTIAIVGSRPGPQIRALSDDPRITVAGDVDSVTPWYAGAAVAAVPILSGGGTRTKVIEALAHRRPVVSTTLGAAGLPFSSESLLLADDAEAFAAACRRLLDHPDLAARLAARGEQEVLRTSTVAVVGARIEALVRHILHP